jgi:hypothetical protein
MRCAASEAPIANFASLRRITSHMPARRFEPGSHRRRRILMPPNTAYHDTRRERQRKSRRFTADREDDASGAVLRTHTQEASVRYMKLRALRRTLHLLI